MAQDVATGDFDLEAVVNEQIYASRLQACAERKRASPAAQSPQRQHQGLHHRGSTAPVHTPYVPVPEHVRRSYTDGARLASTRPASDQRTPKAPPPARLQLIVAAAPAPAAASAASPLPPDTTAPPSRLALAHHMHAHHPAPAKPLAEDSDSADAVRDGHSTEPGYPGQQTAPCTAGSSDAMPGRALDGVAVLCHDAPGTEARAPGPERRHQRGCRPWLRRFGPGRDAAEAARSRQRLCCDLSDPERCVSDSGVASANSTRTVLPGQEVSDPALRAAVLDPGAEPPCRVGTLGQRHAEAGKGSAALAAGQRVDVMWDGDGEWSLKPQLRSTQFQSEAAEVIDAGVAHR